MFSWSIREIIPSSRFLYLGSWRTYLTAKSLLSFLFLAYRLGRMYQIYFSESTLSNQFDFFIVVLLKQ